MDNLKQHLATKAYVRNFVEEELRRRHEGPNDDEPEVTFSVKLPVSDMGRLEQVAAYLGQKKTPFASELLARAVEDAYWAIIQAEEQSGRGDEARAYFERRHELESGSGWVQISDRSSREGEVK